jgi:hypothetical protein
MTQFHIGWPEGIWIGLALVALFVAMALDGQPRIERIRYERIPT